MTFVESLTQDVRYAIRAIARAPAFSSVVILTLAVVIAAATSIFSVASALLLRPASGRDPDRLVRVSNNRGSSMLYVDYIEYRDRSRTVDVATYESQRVAIRIDGQLEAAFGELVSENYFSVVGIDAAVGRMIRSEDGRAGSPAVAVLSDRFWDRRFRRDPAVVGRSIEINEVPFVVVGVAPPSFRSAYEVTAADLWIPVSLDPALRPGTSLLDRNRSRDLPVVGRLRPGISMAAARADLTAIATSLQTTFPQTNNNRSVTIEPSSVLPSEVSGQAALLLGILLGVAGLLLFAACLNVANLLLARGAGRAREVALRRAIGAGRARLVRQFLFENLALSLLAGAAGLGLTWWITAALTRLPIPAPVPLAVDFVPDLRVIAFAIALTLSTTILCGLAPALQRTRGDLLPALKHTAGIAAGSRLRSAFVIAQMTSSVLLLVVAGLFLRSLVSASTIDVGMNTANVLLATLETESRGYSEPRAQEFYRELRDRIAAIPGVAATSLVATVPLTLDNVGMRLPGPNRTAAPVRVSFNAVSAGHFDTVGIRLLEGRDFDARDTGMSTQVAIVNEALARAWFGSQSPVGQLFEQPAFRDRPAVQYEIVGVASNAKYASVGENQQLFAYFPITQRFTPTPTLMVRTGGDPAALAPAVRRVVASLDGGLPLFRVETFASSAAISLLPARFAAAITGVLGALVLALAAMGLYGVIAFLVRQRTREIGIRMSLGDTSTGILRLFLRQSLSWAAIGLGIGLLLAAAVTRLMAGLLFGISPLDPATFGAVILLMLTVASAASLAPARRAARVNPAETLRTE